MDTQLELFSSDMIALHSRCAWLEFGTEKWQESRGRLLLFLQLQTVDLKKQKSEQQIERSSTWKCQKWSVSILQRSLLLVWRVQRTFMNSIFPIIWCCHPALQNLPTRTACTNNTFNKVSASIISNISTPTMSYFSRNVYTQSCCPLNASL